MCLKAGSAVLFHPLILHCSVKGGTNWDKIKFVVGVDLQDLATINNPDDPNDISSITYAIMQRRKESRMKNIN